MVVWILKFYKNTDLLNEEIAKKFNIGETTVSRRVREFNLEKKTNKKRKLTREEYQKEVKVKVWLVKNYQNSDKTIDKIAKKFDCNKEWVVKMIKDLEL
jgi:transposase-like protein